jgi:hypothetical protein
MYLVMHLADLCFGSWTLKFNAKTQGRKEEKNVH